MAEICSRKLGTNPIVKARYVAADLLGLPRTHHTAIAKQTTRIPRGTWLTKALIADAKTPKSGLMNIYGRTGLINMATSSLFRETLMSLNKGLAAVLKSARSVSGLSQQDLGDAVDRTYVWMMENAKSSPTVNKLEQVATALNFDLVTLLALSVAVRDQTPVTEVLERVQNELAEFERKGGLSLLAAQVEGRGPTRTSEKLRKIAAVQDCKRRGLTQKEAVEELGIPRSTVHDLWKLTP